MFLIIVCFQALAKSLKKNKTTDPVQHQSKIWICRFVQWFLHSVFVTTTKTTMKVFLSSFKEHQSFDPSAFTCFVCAHILTERSQLLNGWEKALILILIETKYVLSVKEILLIGSDLNFWSVWSLLHDDATSLAEPQSWFLSSRCSARCCPRCCSSRCSSLSSRCSGPSEILASSSRSLFPRFLCFAGENTIEYQL